MSESFTPHFTFKNENVTSFSTGSKKGSSLCLKVISDGWPQRKLKVKVRTSGIFQCKEFLFIDLKAYDLNKRVAKKLRLS